MKKLLVLTALLAFVFFGCNTDSSIVEPDMSISTLGKTEVNWIKLPVSKDGMLKKDVLVGQDVEGAIGATLAISDSYEGLNGPVSMSASLQFLPGAFDSSRYITMNINDQFGEGTFSPHGVFDIPAVYNITISGVDLTGINPATITFVYLAEDGTYEYPVNDGITADLTTGTLQIVNAQLPHFSRYGFTNED